MNNEGPVNSSLTLSLELQADDVAVRKDRFPRCSWRKAGLISPDGAALRVQHDLWRRVDGPDSVRVSVTVYDLGQAVPLVDVQFGQRS